MKKKFLMKATLAVLLLAALGSCKKEEEKNLLGNANESADTEVCIENEEGLRYDTYTQAYYQSLDIIESLTCEKHFDVDDMFDLDWFSGGGYVFCVPSVTYSNSYLIIFPSPSISAAFIVHTIQDFVSGSGHALTPLKIYDYEIYDACDGDLLLDGKIYPNLADRLFVVSNVYTTNFAAYQYNLTHVFNNASTGTYPCQGPIQTTPRLTLDEFLSCVAQSCYLNLH